MYEFGPNRLDPQSRSLVRDGRVVALTPKAFDLLLALVRSAGSVVGKDELLRQVWSDAVVEEGSLPRAVSTLRKALGDEQYIVTVPGRGYQFVCEVRARAPRPSIAVLPLVNLSSDPDQEYFADGLAEELLDMLSKVPGLRVASRTSAFSFKGKNDDARTIAARLDVATLLEGSVRKSGDRVRITVQLVNAKDGCQLWSETYDRKLVDVFAVQDEIARSVVAALKLKLLPGQAPTSRLHWTGNPEVYTQYLLGRQFFNRSTLDGYRRAEQAFAKAIALDPEFAPAWAGSAQAAYWIADCGADLYDGKLRALAAAEKAVALAPDLADAYVARGSIRSLATRDWNGARSDLERALALSPESADARRSHSLFVLRPLGRIDEAIAMMQKAGALDPLNARTWSALGSLWICLGRFVEAHDVLDRSLEINPEQDFAPIWLGIALLLEGRAEAALHSFQRSGSELRRLMGEALAHHDLGNAADSQRALQTLVARSGQAGAYQVAAAHAWFGETDASFDWLDRALAQNDPHFRLLKMDPLMRNLHGDPRWPALLKKLNLPLD